MKRSYRAARLLGSRRILVVKTSTGSITTSGKRRNLYPRVDALAKRFILLGRVYVPFDAKDGHIYMVETNEDYNRTPSDEQGDFARMSFQDFISLNNPISLNAQQVCFSLILNKMLLTPFMQPISKWATRFDLGTSTSVPVLEFQPDNIVFIEDIGKRLFNGSHAKLNSFVVAEGCQPGEKVPAEMCMTDGGGFLNVSAATLIAQRVHLSDRPTAIQGRIAGSKGVWVLHPLDRDPTAPPRIWIRRSQHKIVLRDLAAPAARCHRIFDLVQPARVSAPARLSMQLLMNMAHNGVPDAVFENLLKASLKEETASLTDWTRPHAMARLWAAVARAGNVPATRLQRVLPAGAARALGLASRFDMERTAGADVYIETETQTDAVEMDPAFRFVVPKEEGRGGPDMLHESVMELLQAGFRPQESSFLYQKLRFVLDGVAQNIVSKYRIPVKRSAEAFAIAGEYSPEKPVEACAADKASLL
jgi:RNA-dependent RNA polymerase